MTKSDRKSKDKGTSKRKGSFSSWETAAAAGTSSSARKSSDSTSTGDKERSVSVSPKDTSTTSKDLSVAPKNISETSGGSSGTPAAPSTNPGAEPEANFSTDEDGPESVDKELQDATRRLSTVSLRRRCLAPLPGPS